MRNLITRALMLCVVFGFVFGIEAATRVVLLEEAYWSG